MTTTTPTAADALAERKVILEGNSALLVLRDTLQQDVDRLQPVLVVIKEEIKASGALPELTRLQDAYLAAELAPKRQKAQQELDAVEKRIRDKQAEEGASNGRILANKAIAAGHVAAIATLEQTHLEYAQKARDSRERHASMMNTYQAELMQIEVQLMEARKSLAKTQEEEKGLLEHRSSEELRLATKGRDLAIYEERIRKAGGQLDPPMQIHV